MNNNRIINCIEGINENDVCTIKNLRSNRTSMFETLMSTYHMIGNELNMRNQRITGVADEVALNDAVNINQLNNLSRNLRQRKTFSYKSGRLLLIDMKSPLIIKLRLTVLL